MAAAKKNTKKAAVSIDEELAALGLTAAKRGPKKGTANARTEAARTKVAGMIEKAEKAGKVVATIPASEFSVSDEQVKTYVQHVLSESDGWKYHAKMIDKAGGTVYVVAKS